MRIERRTAELVKLLELCTSHLEPLATRAQEITEGVARNADGDSGKAAPYSLPKAFVKAFEHLVIFIIAAGHTVRLIDRHFKNWTPKDCNPLQSETAEHWKFIDYLGWRAQVSMAKVLKDVILMIRTGEASENVNYTAVGPRHIILILYKSLLSRTLAENSGIVELYGNCVSKLVCKAS